VNNKLYRLTLGLVFILTSPLGHSADYEIDIEGMHASIQFRIQHLGFSWLVGRFNEFSGRFSYDPEHPENASVQVQINPASIDSNHAKRDKHLRDKDFLYVDKFPQASFVSTAVTASGDDKLTINGELTLRGVTRPVSIHANKVGSGPDPWGGFRLGFSGTTTLVLKDFGIEKFLGPASTQVELLLDIEGVKQPQKTVGKR
jgi:polyisoprenoid-binding protein YceI